MPPVLEDRCRDLLAELGIINPGEKFDAIPLTGGVASDIAMIKIGNKKLCVKFALPKLKVEADWFAPVHRNAAEYAWLETATEVAPDCAIELLGRSEALHGFAMEYLEGDDIYLWKTELLRQAQDRGEAAKVGDLLGRVHSASTKPAFSAEAFRNWDDFLALRIEPYITHTALQHSGIAPILDEIAQQLYRARRVLVHGDVSPKNILFRATGPVILDAECATMGDASFDPSFCMNHLVLKAVHLPGSRARYLANAVAFWRAYAAHITWETRTDVEARICTLLPALMLGRIDGKSPVEYLTESERKTVRRIATQFIETPVGKLDDLIQGIGASLKEMAV